MTKHNNQAHEELRDAELDAVVGGFMDDAGCTGPWILSNGRITMRQPAGPNPWLPGGIFHG